jgi:hypothetical protein
MRDDQGQRSQAIVIVNTILNPMLLEACLGILCWSLSLKQLFNYIAIMF